jgi:hypothetical protein
VPSKIWTYFFGSIHVVIFIVAIFCGHGLFAQDTRAAYSFLDVASPARFSALGGVNVSLADRDVNGFLFNPVLSGDTLAGFASANYQFNVADIGHASFSYLPTIKKVGTIAIGIQHYNYGSIESYDPSGNSLGEFHASETALIVSKNHQVQNFRFGASIKTAFSNLAGFRSSAIMFDLGGLFIHPEKELTIGLTLRNAGFVLSDYTDGSDSKLPIDVQVGATFKPKHMPFRFSLTTYRLIQPSTSSVVDSQLKSTGTIDKLFRHFNLGTEILLHRNVNILVGYNYARHQELKLEKAGGSAGLSYGFSARVKTFEFVFSRSIYVVGTAAYAFTLSSNINKLLNR